MFKTHKPDRKHLMEVLWDIQKNKRCIESEEIVKVAQAFDMSRIELEGIISFYHFYHFDDAGKYTVYLDTSIIAEHGGRQEIRQAFEEATGTTFGSVTPDLTFGLFDTPCIGLSDQEPACLINFRPFTSLTPQKVFNIVTQLKAGKRPSEICDVPKTNIRYTPPADRTVFFKPYEKFSALAALRDRTPDEIIDTVEQSKLAGYGGAFFPTGKKWRFCRQTPAEKRYVIANADEGEPGTFKDRVLLQTHPELLIEGLIFAAYAVGASEGAIYLRAEYMYLKEELDRLLVEYRRKGFLGKNIPAKTPFEFDLYVHLGAGAYVCGEETALIHSMEGRRGEPGTKEYFPVQKGFLGQPTVVNNVETLSAVPRVFEAGVENWLKVGTAKTPGTKIISVSGDCTNPGIYEIEWGTDFNDFLRMTGARDPKMVQLSGPSGVCVAVAVDPKTGLYLVDGQDRRALSGEDLACGGSFMIFDETRNILKVLKSYSDFFVAESCGLCVPCRTGNFLLNKKLQKLINGHGEKKDLHEITEWSEIIKTTSRCGLGQFSNNSLLLAIDKFPDVIDRALADNTDFNPAFNIETATAEYDRIVEEINANYD